MDRIELLQARKAAIAEASKNVRGEIRALSDEDSFVELYAFRLSDEADGELPAGEGVVTGFCTVGGYPFYVVAQNYARDLGGLTKANCDKIVKTLSAAEKSGTPVVWLLHSGGAKIGEGTGVLEGIAELLSAAVRLKDEVTQYAVICGDVYGAAAAIAAVADVVFFPEGGTLAVTSPYVLAARAGKELKKEEVGGYDALKNAVLPAVKVRDLEEVSALLKQFTELFGMPVCDAELNAAFPSLNVKSGGEEISALIEDGVELGANACPEIKTVLGRVGGVAVAAAIFDGARLNERNLRKIKNFAQLASDHGLPFVTFVDCAGVEPALSVNDSGVLKEMAEYLSVLGAAEIPKIAVVTGHASGLGYSLFAAKSAGFDYVYALATAGVALFESAQGAEIFYGGAGDKAELLSRYEEEYADPVFAAKDGYLDNVVEPQFVKQYLIASLQMLMR